MSDLINRFTGRHSTWEPLAEDSELAQFFTDAEVAIQAFEELVAAEKLPKRLLVIHGVGGVGKSTLLRMYRLACHRRGIPMVLFDGRDVVTPMDLLDGWASDLSRQKVNLRGFQRTLKQYRALQLKLEAKGQSEAQDRKWEVGKGVVQAGTGIGGSLIPGAGVWIGPVASLGAGMFMDRLSATLAGPDLELYRDATRRLTDKFLTGLYNVSRKRRLVLMVDTYEQMAALDGWMCGLARQMTPRVLLVIAGRTLPEWGRDWPGWPGMARVVRMEEMALEDQRALVRRYCAYLGAGQPEPGQVEALVAFAGGLPLAITTVVQLWREYGVSDLGRVKPQAVASLARRVLEGVPPEMRAGFEAAAILRYFSVDSLRALLGDGDAHTLYRELERWPFIRSEREGLAVHDRMREVISEAVAMRSQVDYRALHERAAAHYADLRAGSRGEAREAATVEMLYHAVRANESRGTALLEELFDEAEGQSWSGQERLFTELLRAELDDTLRAQVLRKLTAPLAYQGKGAEALPYLEEALAIYQREGDSIGAAWTRLELCWQVKDRNERQRHIDLALDVFREVGDKAGLAIAEAQIGWNYLNRWEAAAARAAFYRSLETHEQLGDRGKAAFVKERIGQTYLIEGNFLEAIALKEEALATFQELEDEWSIAWTLDELATCYSWTGQWELALQSLERAQGILGTWGDQREAACVFRQGDIFRKQGRLELALETYQRSLSMAPSQGTWSRQGNYAGLGYIHLAQDAFDDALADFQQAIDVFAAGNHDFGIQAVGNSYLGDWHLAQGHTTEAFEHYALCVETARAKGNYLLECLALVGMSQARYLEGHSDQVDALIARAEELGQEHRYFQLLSDIHLLRGHMALDRTSEGSASLGPTIHSYSTSLKHALRYNRFSLDETTEAIIAHCRERGEEGQQVLIALHDLWQTGRDDEGVTLLEAERAAREREPGDGAPQVSLLERIEQALNRKLDAE